MHLLQGECEQDSDPGAAEPPRGLVPGHFDAKHPQRQEDEADDQEDD